MDEDNKKGKNNGSTTQHKLGGLSFEEKNLHNQVSCALVVLFHWLEV